MDKNIDEYDKIYREMFGEPKSTQMARKLLKKINPNIKSSSESLTAGELIEILKQVDPNSIVEIHDYDESFTIKKTTIENDKAILFTFKN